MTAVPDCSVSDTYLFTQGFVQSDIVSGRYEDIYGITKLKTMDQLSLLLIMCQTSSWILV